MNVMNYGKCGDLSVKWEYSKTYTMKNLCRSNKPEHF